MDPSRLFRRVSADNVRARALMVPLAPTPEEPKDAAHPGLPNDQSESAASDSRDAPIPLSLARDVQEIQKRSRRISRRPEQHAAGARAKLARGRDPEC